MSNQYSRNQNSFIPADFDPSADMYYTDPRLQALQKDRYYTDPRFQALQNQYQNSQRVRQYSPPQQTRPSQPFVDPRNPPQLRSFQQQYKNLPFNVPADFDPTTDFYYNDPNLRALQRQYKNNASTLQYSPQQQRRASQQQNDYLTLEQIEEQLNREYGPYYRNKRY